MLTSPAEPDGERRWRLFLWLCAALRGDPVQWPADTADGEQLILLASCHFVTPTLALALNGTANLPDAVGDYLGAVVHLNGARNALIVSAVEDIATCLTSHGIDAVFLKGAAHLCDGLYDYPAERLLGDVDVLVPAAAAPEASRALAAIGFSDIKAPPRRWISLRLHHLPMQQHVESGVGVEVHAKLLFPAFDRLLPSDVALRTAVPARHHPNIQVLAPSLRALHTVIHDQLVDQGWHRRTCSLRAVSDLSRLRQRPGAEAELADMADRLPPRLRRIARHMLALAGPAGAVEDVETMRAYTRLKRGVEQPRSNLSLSMVSGFQRMRYQPAAVINLLDPSRWSERLARL